jgi:hypothetical protein
MLFVPRSTGLSGALLRSRGDCHDAIMAFTGSLVTIIRYSLHHVARVRRREAINGRDQRDQDVYNELVR